MPASSNPTIGTRLVRQPRFDIRDCWSYLAGGPFMHGQESQNEVGGKTRASAAARPVPVLVDGSGLAVGRWSFI